jgi:hypothetical protein
MTTESQSAQEILKSVWEVKGDLVTQLDEDCSPTKSCKNMQGITFDGFAEAAGTDLRSAWKQTLQREGKLNGDSASLRDLILGPNETK